MARASQRGWSGAAGAHHDRAADFFPSASRVSVITIVGMSPSRLAAVVREKLALSPEDRGIIWMLAPYSLATAAAARSRRVSIRAEASAL